MPPQWIYHFCLKFVNIFVDKYYIKTAAFVGNTDIFSTVGEWKKPTKNRPKISCRIAIPTGNSSHLRLFAFCVKSNLLSPPSSCGMQCNFVYNTSLFKRDSDRCLCVFLRFLPISTLHHCLFSVNIFRMKTIFSTF